MSTVPAPEQLLVCAPVPGGEPLVVLADGSYETDADRVFWRRTPDTPEGEVLRVPLDTEVAVRPVRRFSSAPRRTTGEQALLAAVAPYVPQQRRARTDAAELLREMLGDAIRAGEAQAAHGAAEELVRLQGLDALHRELAGLLREVSAHRAAGSTGPAQERRAVQVVRTLLERLRPAPATEASGGDLVLLMTPPGDRHALALLALAQQLQAAGRRTLIAEELPLTELVQLLREEPCAAVVVSAHLDLPAGDVRRLVAAVRGAHPRAVIALGGPGATGSLRGVDLVSDDPAQLLALLSAGPGVLTPREREVLHLVAEGCTNNEIAQALGLSAGTVKSHLDHVLAKTGTVHRAAAVARALRQGWIT